MIKHSILAALVAFGLGSTGALAAGGENHIEDFAFSFEGPFGKFDPMQLQRGLQVYTEVCSACHGLRQVAFRTLGDEGGPQMEAEQVKAFAKLFEVIDDDDDAEPGDTREAKPSDKFPVNTAVGAPDLSLMAKARAGFHGPMGSGLNQLFKGMGGAEYIASILTGYTGHEKDEAGVTLYENTAFPGGWISMAPPLEDDAVEYRDGHSADVRHMSQDVAAFLMWTAEPKMMARKRTGFLAVSFMILLTSLLYLTNKKLWAGPKRKDA
ncbi:MAG: ubiquinol-cytochrome c reductase cytochrome c1 subunit [Paracoccaceae bacterium]|jgi:ubiquinol-cytochrome c reductase cytochrome c1 subunit